MNSTATLRLPRPLLERWANDIAARLARGWQQRRTRRDRERSIAAMADLSGAVLRDIGGPEELLNQAAARRRVEAECREELRILANYRAVDSRFW